MLHWNVREEGRWIFFEDVCVRGGAESWWVVRSRLNRTEGEAGGDPASAHILPRHSKQSTTGLLKQCNGYTAGWLCFHTKNINLFGGWCPSTALLHVRGYKRSTLLRTKHSLLLVVSNAGLHFEIWQKCSEHISNTTRVRVLWYSYPMRCKCWYQKYYTSNATFLRGIILKLCL